MYIFWVFQTFSERKDHVSTICFHATQEFLCYIRIYALNVYAFMYNSVRKCVHICT